MKLTDFLIFCEGFNPKNYAGTPTKKNILQDIAVLFERELRAKYPEKNFPTVDTIAEALIKRENLVTTGVGYGVALPTGRVKRLPITRFGIYKTPSIDWASMDGKPVDIIVPTIGPHDRTGRSLDIVPYLSYLMHERKSKEGILKATNPLEMDMKTLTSILTLEN